MKITQIADGMLFAAVPAGATLEIGSDTLVPAMLGEADDRRLSLAIYAIAVSGADGTARSLDLDDPAQLPRRRAAGGLFRMSVRDL